LFIIPDVEGFDMEEKKKLNLNRIDMPKQPEFIRRRNFMEVALGYTAELALEEAGRCLECKKPMCREGCPVEINIPEFIGHIKRQDYTGAIKVIKETNCLPAVCGRVCPQEEQCEARCILGKKGAPVAIGRLERFAADWEAAQEHMEMPMIPEKTGKKVAVIGSGPAGITVAGDLILRGHEVTLFEALHEPGGVLTYGIPEFRLPGRIVQREIEYLQKLGVKLVCNFVVGKTRSMEKIREEHDAVFIGTGAGLPWFMNIPGENLNGVYSANEYLTRVNLMRGFQYPKTYTPVKRHHHVAVVGGGNVAMDCARTAMRLGAGKVFVLYRRSEAELPARREEYENAAEEGVIFHFLTLPEKLLGNDNGWLHEIECSRMELGEPDASGRRKPVRVDGSEFRIPMDACIVAIGNSPNPIIPSTTTGLDISRKGTIVVDEETGRTSLDRVWAGGDIVTGAATVILAMGAGRKAARAIHHYLTTGL